MVFSLSYGTTKLGLDRQFLILTVTASAVLWFFSIPLWTRLADRSGRRTMFLTGSVALLIWAAVFFPLLDTKNTAVVVLAIWSARSVWSALSPCSVSAPPPSPNPRSLPPE